MKKHSPIPVGSMDVSALAIPGIQVRSASLALDDDFDVQLAGLKRFARAEQVEIMERRTFTLAASPSLFVKIRYLDSRDRRLWIDEVIFTRRDGLSYRLELETRADQLQRFEANFAQFVNSFQMNCGSRSIPQDHQLSRPSVPRRKRRASTGALCLLNALFDVVCGRFYGARSDCRGLLSGFGGIAERGLGFTCQFAERVRSRAESRNHAILSLLISVAQLRPRPTCADGNY